MHSPAQLAVIRAAVFIAVIAATRTRLTPDLFLLFMGFLLFISGVPAAEPGPFMRDFSALGDFVSMFALG